MKKHRHVKGNFYGISKVKFLYHGQWADPEIIYKNHSFNYYDLEGALWDYFLEEKGITQNQDKYKDDFKQWVFDNQQEAHNLLDDWIFCGCV